MTWPTAPDVVVVSYRHLVKDPRHAIEPVLNLLGLRFDPDLIAHIDRRESASVTKVPLEIDPRIRAMCAALEERLDAVAQAHHERAVPVHPTVPAPRGRPTEGMTERSEVRDGRDHPVPGLTVGRG